MHDRSRAVIIVLLLATAPARADRPRYTRTPHLDLPVTLSDRVKPIQPVAAPPRTPAMSADAVMQIKERERPVRVEQEKLLVKLIADTPDDDPDKPDYMFRLAEHYAEQLRFWRLKSVEATIDRTLRRTTTP